VIASALRAPLLVLPMPTVAEQLRQGREALKLEIAQVAEVTKLKTDQIRALEEGDYDSFSAPVYLRGSVRTYAKLVKLDALSLIEQLDTELRASKKFPDEFSVPVRKKSALDSLMLLLSRLNWMVAAIVIVVVALVLGGNAAYRSWKNRTAADPLKKLGSGMYQQAEPAGELLPLPTNVGTNIKPQTPNNR